MAAAIGVGGAFGGWRGGATAPAPASIRAPWVDACVARMERARLRLADVSAELGRAEVQQAWSVHAAWAELRLLPQYSAKIEYRPADESPSVFDWEEAPTPVAGSFALHRHVGHYDLLVVADDSDDEGLAFAARMQPLLDECLIEAQE
ncbi:MAG: hypothetical protein ACXVCV_01390 [Polyangia bacterium]